MGLLVKGCYLISSEQRLELKDVYIRKDRIEAIGLDLKGDLQDEVIYARNQLLTSGLVNSHTHVSMSLLRGIADDMPLKEWLEQEIWPRENKFKAEDIYWGALLGIVEMIKGGITTFVDMYFYEEEVARAALESGIRACLSPGMIYRDSTQGEKALKDSIHFIKSWDGRGDRIIPAFGPHAIYTCPPSYLKEVSEEAKRLKVPVHLHFLEASWERNFAFDNYKLKPVELLRETGLLDTKLLLAHGVHLTLDEARELSSHQSYVIHNPTSNLKLASGIAPVNGFLKEGLKVILGTDGPASNNDLDMWEEGRLMSFLQKGISKDPTTMDAHTTFSIMTKKGYEALGLKGGNVEEGYLADLILIGLGTPRLTPIYNGYSHLVYNVHPEDVRSTIVGGKVIMKDREILTVNEEEIMVKVNNIARRIR